MPEGKPEALLQFWFGAKQKEIYLAEKNASWGQ